MRIKERPAAIQSRRRLSQPMISVCVSDQIRRLTAAAALPPKRAARAEAAASRTRQARAGSA